MSTSVIKKVTTGRIETPGTYTLISRGVVPAYVTGSGNYFDFSVPVEIDDALSVSGATIHANSRVFFAGTAVSSIGLTTSTTWKNKTSLTCEFPFNASQTPNSNGTALLIDLKITVV